MHTGAEWKALLPSTLPATPPRMQIFHGEADTLVNFNYNFREQIKEWAAINDVSETASVTEYPVAPSGHVWTRTRYGGTGPQAPVEAKRQLAEAAYAPTSRPSAPSTGVSTASSAP